MLFQHLVQGAAARLGLSSEVPADARSLQISFKDGSTVSVEFHEHRNTVSLAALLCFYPVDSARAGLFETLLHAHTFGLLTDGASFGVEPESSKVFLFKTLPLDQLDSEAFAAAVESFHKTWRFWKDAADAGKLAGDAAAARAPSIAAVPMGSLA